MSVDEPSLARRRAGVLLHPTSLPSGELGADARRFVDFLAAAGVSVWQTLPLGPNAGSPYQCLSAHAGNPELVAQAPLIEAGWLDDEQAPRGRALAAAREGFEARASAAQREHYREFIAGHRHWLEDFALFMALREHHDRQPWWQWPEGVRDRAPRALEDASEQLADAVEQHRFEQYLFFEQWHRIRRHAHDRGVYLFGDMPIFVAHDSAEVWAHREYFTLDEHGATQAVAGVPPDYFSETGQLWGNPLFRWDVIAADGYRWWIERMRTQLELFDLVRVDHFRGFEAHWEIPADAETAMEGDWVQGPGAELFDALYESLGGLPLVAEDLGLITPPVEALRDRFGLPGMKVLQFAFDGGPDNPYLPHNHVPNSVVYTGTHDNNTTLGWWQEELDDDARRHVADYLGKPREAMPWPLLRSALASVARLAMLPMQDLLGLGAEHRMNRPGTAEGNWQWRFEWDQVPHDLTKVLRHRVQLYGRAVPTEREDAE